MTTLPIVSVIITTYNSSAYLDQAVHSVSQQTLENVELIVVDDCSTNGTQERLIALQRRYAFKLILLEKNSGSASKPFNEGIKIAQGKYIAICAHDDFYLPHKLAKQVEFLEARPHFMMVYSNNFTVCKDETEFKAIKTLKCKSGHIFRELFLQKFYVPALTVVVRKEVFTEIGYFDENLLIEDWDMWLRIANNFPIGYMSEYLACYRNHEHNSMKVYSTRMLKDRKHIIEKWKDTPHYHAAKAINRLIDGDSIKLSFFTLLKDTWIAVVNLRQPYRVLRLFLSNIKREYFLHLDLFKTKDADNVTKNDFPS